MARGVEQRHAADGGAGRNRRRGDVPLRRLPRPRARARHPASSLLFIAAFPLAYEPTKRLGRGLNIDLHTALIGVQVLFDVLDLPRRRAADRQAGLCGSRAARSNSSDVSFSYRAGQPVLRHMSFIAEPGKVTALCRHLGRRQVHDIQPRAGALFPRTRGDPSRRPELFRRLGRIDPAQLRLRQPGRVFVQRHHLAKYCALDL